MVGASYLDAGNRCVIYSAFAPGTPIVDWRLIPQSGCVSMAEQEEQIVQEATEEGNELPDDAEEIETLEAEGVEADSEEAGSSAPASEGDGAGAEESTPASTARSIDALDNPEIPRLRPGDAVSVHVLIMEGDRERVQEFRGTVIRIRKGGNNASFTVRRIASHGIGVERTFLMRSPRVKKVEIQRRAHVRRARLYFLRDRTGKRARLREKRQA